MKTKKIKQIKFSICIPTYNRSEYLKIAVQSALKQEYSNYEIIIVDDGSTDNTEQIVKEFSSGKIGYIKKKHSGAPETRNMAVEISTGDYIVWLADDDILLPGALSFYYIYAIKYPDADIFYCQLKAFNEGLKREHLITPNDWYKDKKGILQFLMSGCPIPDGGSAIKRNVYKEVGTYNPEFKRAHDYEFWSRVIQKRKFEFKLVDKVLYLYRLHNNNLTGIISERTDYSFEAKIVDSLIKNNNMSDLFPNLDWKNNKNAALFESYYFIALKYFLMKERNIGYSHLEKAAEIRVLTDSEIMHIQEILIKAGFENHQVIIDDIKKSILSKSSAQNSQQKTKLKDKSKKELSLQDNYAQENNLNKGQTVMNEGKLTNTQYQKEVESIVNYVNQSNYDDAYMLTKKLLTLPSLKQEIGDNEYLELLNLAGTLSLLRQDYESAQQYFEKELIANPTSARACSGLGDTYFAAEMFKESKIMFEWAVKYEPQNSFALEGLAKVNKKLGLDNDHNTLIQEEVFELITKSEELIKQDKYEEAYNILQEVLEKYPENLDALNNSAVAQILIGNHNKGLDLIEKVLDLDKNNEIAMENLKYLMKITGVVSNEIKS